MPAQTVIVPKKKPQDRKPPAPPKPAVQRSGPAPIIDIEAEDGDIPVRLVGLDYVAHRPKSMLAIRLGERIKSLDMEDVDSVLSSLRSFLLLTFGTETTDLLLARLEDPDDRIDVVHLLAFVERMTEVVSNRPPT